MLFGMVLTVLGILGLLPRWWAPKWYRQMPAERRDFDPTKSQEASLIVGYSGRMGITSADEAEKLVGRTEPSETWKGGWVYDPDASKRGFAASRKGTIMGSLALYPTALVFNANKFEDNLRGKPTVVLVQLADITGVRVVPPRAGVDGVSRKGFFYRSPFSRLVVETTDNAHLFDIGWGRAKKVAAHLNAVATATS